MSTVIVGIASQVWLRKYHRKWYMKYNYIFGGALDGGAQLMIFILSFAVFGAAGVSRPFPSVRIYTFAMGYSLTNGSLTVGRKPCEGKCRLLQWKWSFVTFSALIEADCLV